MSVPYPSSVPPQAQARGPFQKEFQDCPLSLALVALHFYIFIHVHGFCFWTGVLVACAAVGLMAFPLETHLQQPRMSTRETTSNKGPFFSTRQTHGINNTETWPNPQ